MKMQDNVLSGGVLQLPDLLASSLCVWLMLCNGPRIFLVEPAVTPFDELI